MRRGPRTRGSPGPSPHLLDSSVTAPGIPNELVLSTSCFGSRLTSIEDQAFAAVAMGFRLIELGLARMSEMPLLSRLSSGDGELALALSEVDASVLERVNTWQAAFLVDLLRAATDGELTEAALEDRSRVLVDLIAAVIAGARTASRTLPVRVYARLVADILVYGVTRPPDTDRATLLAALEAAMQPSLREARS